MPEDTGRMDSAALPPYNSLLHRRLVARRDEYESVREAVGSGRFGASDEFDPSPHARRMCNLCGMTKTCTDCRAVVSLFSSPRKGSPLCTPHQNLAYSTPRAVRPSEWELLGNSLGKSRGAQPSSLSRATTVSSRMRDAYIDQV